MDKPVFVTLCTVTVGQSFASRGIVRSAKTGRVLASCGVRPQGMDAAALADASALATTRGYRVVEARS